MWFKIKKGKKIKTNASISQLYIFPTDKQTSPGILPRTLILISVRPRSGSVGHEPAHASYLPLDGFVATCTCRLTGRFISL